MRCLEYMIVRAEAQEESDGLCQMAIGFIGHLHIDVTLMGKDNEPHVHSNQQYDVEK